MALKIRLARGGAKKRPHYSIVVAEASSPRDGRYIEQIGRHNPMVEKDHKERLIVDTERAKYWLSVGALPTERVARFFSQLSLVKAPDLRSDPKKSQPKKKAQERIKADADRIAAEAEAKIQAEREAQEAAQAAKAVAEAPAPAEEAPAEAPAEASPEASPAEVAPEAPAEAAPAEEAPATEETPS
jgi:small subunit ribosomal protein S16